MAGLTVVTYNVLSSSLAKPSFFHNTEPQYLNADMRMSKLRIKLIEWFRRESVICLQELSNKWYAELVTFCAMERYRIIYYNYVPNGSLGVATLIPLKYGITDTQVRIISDLIWNSGEDLVEGVPYPWYKSIVNTLSCGYLCRRPQWVRPAHKYSNAVIIVEFTTGDKKYRVSNYHMPCAFDRREVMELHLKYLKRAIFPVNHQKAFEDDDINNYYESEVAVTKPTNIICGDFNLAYNDGLITKFKNGYNVQLASVFDEGAPEYTNKTDTAKNGVFSGVIDNIFYESAECKFAAEVDCTGEFLPNFDEPSDHLPIIAHEC